jgi:putative membrane protein insertion efficiency factor
MTAWIGRTFALAIAVYRRFISPSLGRHCRYHPSCAAYAQGCVERHGPFHGGALAIWRLLRCNPFVRGGYDPVPPARRIREVSSAARGSHT